MRTTDRLVITGSRTARRRACPGPCSSIAATHEAVVAAYTRYGHELVTIPRTDVGARVEFILRGLRTATGRTGC
jgi:predicted ATPase